MIQILLGELLGNPKGTKSFSSWSEFTDFVNEMPIKTIQPFVSNFNAFAGEGFYGNVVQGLVIKQLEDAVFIFGIAIDGTLIFRKRNYPDVSTWEDPKIIIHSNNWHKIYFVTDLGGLIGVTTPTKDGLMPKNQVCRNIAKINNLHCRLKCNISSPGEWVNGFLYVGSTSGSVSTIAVSVMIWNETKVFCKLINGVKRTEYYETIRPGVSFSIGAPTNEFVYVSHNDGEMMIYVDSTGIVTKIFSSADKIISISLKDNQIMITAINYDLIVTIRVLSF